jgi:hypothetical protein
VAEGRREIYLDRWVTVECPRLMNDAELADILAAFVEKVRASKVRAPVTEPKGDSPRSLASSNRC